MVEPLEPPESELELAAEPLELAAAGAPAEDFEDFAADLVLLDLEPDATAGLAAVWLEDGAAAAEVFVDDAADLLLLVSADLLLLAPPEAGADWDAPLLLPAAGAAACAGAAAPWPALGAAACSAVFAEPPLLPHAASTRLVAATTGTVLRAADCQRLTSNSLLLSAGNCTRRTGTVSLVVHPGTRMAPDAGSLCSRSLLCRAGRDVNLGFPEGLLRNRSAREKSGTAGTPGGAAEARFSLLPQLKRVGQATERSVKIPLTAPTKVRRLTGGDEHRSSFPVRLNTFL